MEDDLSMDCLSRLFQGLKVCLLGYYFLLLVLDMIYEMCSTYLLSFLATFGCLMIRYESLFNSEHLFA